MASNSSQVEAWILRNAELFKIEELLWTQKVLPELRDIAVHLKFKDVKISGWGTAESSNRALVKACTEAIERTILISNKIANSNGVAGHEDFARASEAAVHELIERDLFLCHFYSNIPFSKGSTKPIENSRFERALDWLKRNHVEVLLHPVSRNGFVSSFNGFRCSKPFGYIIGAGVSSDSGKAAASAFIEGFRRCYSLISGGKDVVSISLEDFKTKKSFSFQDHGKLALNIDYARSIMDLFAGGDEYSFVESKMEINVEQLHCDQLYFPECPLVFARARSSDTQSLFTGWPTDREINQKRLREFADSFSRSVRFNPLPHPFD